MSGPTKAALEAELDHWKENHRHQGDELRTAQTQLRQAEKDLDRFGGELVDLKAKALPEDAEARVIAQCAVAFDEFSSRFGYDIDGTSAAPAAVERVLAYMSARYGKGRES